MLLLNDFYSRKNNIEDVSHDWASLFFEEVNFDSFQELYNETDKTQIKNIHWPKKKQQKTEQNKKRNRSFNLMRGSYVVHRFNVTGEINGYTQGFCKQNIRENQTFIPIFAHKKFSFNFLFAFKGIRLCVWRTKQWSIDGNNFTNINFENIGYQVKVLDIIKFYQ